MFISYAQSFEDVILWRALKHVEKGFYIDIGAQDPIFDSVSYGFYEKGWRGVHVEPNIFYASKIKALRLDEEVLQFAIATEEKSISFFEIPETGLSTGNASIALEHQKNGFKVKEVIVDTLRLDSLLHPYANKDIHWMKIDVEGMESEVLKSWSDSPIRPWIVVVESTLPLTQIETFNDWEELLICKGYVYVYFDGLNRFYVSNNHTELKAAFRYPPCIFDDFVLSSSTSYARCLHYEIETYKSQLKFVQEELDLSRKELHSVYNTFLGKFVKSYKDRKKRRIDSEDECYIKIEKNDLTIKFHKQSLIDNRGIGRVSRELLNNLNRIETSINAHGFNQKTVYFYASVHWCPSLLPHPSCVMVHDITPMLFPELYKNASKKWQQFYKPIVQQADIIVTISHSSSSDIARLLDIPEGKIHVIHNGVTKLPVAEKAKGYILPVNYVVYLGANDLNKNLKILLDALLLPASAGVDLVLIGDNEGLKLSVSDLGLDSRVYFLGKLDDNQVGYVISNALALVFPSLYEGFGLPPFEAALLDVPSICSSRPAMTELLEGSAFLISPYDASEWANAIYMVHNNRELRNNIAAKAKEKALMYTWEKNVSQLVEVLSLL